ncbi:hypothetical protein AltI4_31000 [Alteromonas sp. I4]|nr:hypothetical protein AltI4_31000 [Alteromonas sp. I4]
MERTFALYQEFDEAVDCYASQPEYFNVFGARYTPDFLIHYKSGYAEYAEVKHSSFMRDDFSAKHERRKQVIHAINKHDLQLVSELDFNSVQTANYELLYPYKQLDISTIRSEIDYLPKRIPFAKLECAVKKLVGANSAHAWALVANQFFLFDTSQPLRPETKLMRA